MEKEGKGEVYHLVLKAMGYRLDLMSPDQGSMLGADLKCPQSGAEAGNRRMGTRAIRKERQRTEGVVWSKSALSPPGNWGRVGHPL